MIFLGTDPLGNKAATPGVSLRLHCPKSRVHPPSVPGCIEASGLPVFHWSINLQFVFATCKREMEDEVIGFLLGSRIIGNRIIPIILFLKKNHSSLYKIPTHQPIRLVRLLHQPTSQKRRNDRQDQPHHRQHPKQAGALAHQRRTRFGQFHHRAVYRFLQALHAR